jgi:cytoskeletal protein CcmA (bactofilin family)
MRSRRARFFVGVGLIGLLVLLTTGVVLAQEQQLGGKVVTGSEVTIPADETVDHDLYVFAGTVISNGTINGDLVVAGGTVDINGTVQGDVLVAGGRVSINGTVSGDVRVAGGQVVVGSDVSEDLLVAGGQITVGGRVGQDLIVSAGELTLSGSVAGSTIGTVGTYNKSGTVAGTDGISISPRGAPVTPSNPVLDAVRQFIAVLVIAALALWLIPRTFAAAEARVREQPLPSFGWGVVSLIGYVVLVIAIIVLAILLAIVLGALRFGGLLGIDLLGGFVAISGLTLAFIVAGGFLADAIVGLALARLVTARTGSGTTAETSAARGQWADLGLLAAGTAVVVILTAIPALGGLVKFVVASAGLGALWLTWRAARQGPAASIPLPPPSPTAPTA